MRIKILGVAVLASILLVSCTSVPTVWDDSLQDAQMATVAFSGITPLSYNKIAVQNWRFVKIPAGDATIACDVTSSSYSARNKIFTYNFDAGKSYFVVFGLNEGYWGVAIYANPDNKGYPSNKNLLDFVRFQK